MKEIVQNNTFVTVVVGSAIGAGLVELILKLFLSHLLDRIFYKFKLGLTDKRGYADAIIDLLNDHKNSEWPNELQYRSNTISDKLIAIKQRKFSKKLDQYSVEQSMLRDLISLLINHPDSFQSKDASQDYVERSAKQDELRRELIEMAGKLKN